MPAKGSQLRFQVSKIADFGNQCIGLQLVVIDDDGDLVQIVVGCGNQGFPELPLLQFTIARKHVDIAWPLEQSVGDHHALGLGNPHAKRAGVGDDIGGGNIGVTGQPAEAAQLVDQLEIQLALADEGVVKAGRIVPL